MFSFLKKDNITNAVTKINVIPQPQCPVANKYTLKNNAKAAITQRIIKPLII
jgi:hypothetical protein